MHGKREQPNGYSQRQTIKNQLIMNAIAANRGFEPPTSPFYFTRSALTGLRTDSLKKMGEQ